MLDCLINTVGLADTACNCWDSSKPVDFSTINESKSGLYVSENNTLPVNWAAAGADCGTGSIWDMLIHARKQAVRYFLSDFLTAIQHKKTERFTPFKKIGDDYYKSGAIVNGDFVGFWIEPYEVRGAKIIIDSIDIAMWSGIFDPTSIDIFIYDSLDLSTPLASTTANLTANKQYFTASLSTPYIIDLTNVRDDLNQRFYFVYELPRGFVPVRNDTEKGCGCSSQNIYRDNPYLALLNISGVQSNSINELLNPVGASGNMNGLLLNTKFECDYYSWLCELTQDMTSPASGDRLKLGMCLADTLQAKAVMILIDSILTSNRINYYTIISNPEILYSKHGHYNKIYKNGIDNLVYYMPKDVTDCLVCKEDKRIKKSQIII
tara:strand:- start:5048 stop:6181 length:1134 start_codon:yes stop_codon:yes gene_type:complete